MTSRLLSKSKYLNGLQCPKLLWLLFHEPKRIPKPDAATQYIFDQGHMVGELAKKLFPDGINIPEEDFIDNIRQTRKLLQQHKPLFEAGISVGNIYARVDILNPIDEHEWDIFEVKSSTSVKDVHLHDASFQRFCCLQYGLAIRKCYLVHINNEYVKHGEVEPKQLFRIEDITEQVDTLTNGLLDRIEAMLEVISTNACPDIAIGKHCSNPYDCHLEDCWAFLPKNSVFDLYRGGQKCFDLLGDGILSINDIPDSFKLTGIQKLQKECVLSSKPHVDKEEIKRFLSTLHYPLYYLDFETFSPAVPMFDGTRPYQTIPFQFSIHITTSENTELEHFSFLAEGTEDPRPKLLSELCKVLGNEGSIVVYNQAFEKGVLKELGNAFPEYAVWVENVCNRIVDLLSPFRSFHYYHPLQKGSASLKAVLPALTGKSYEGMDIDNGEVASIAFQAVTYGDVSDEVRNKVREDLKKYCGLDTEGMIWIVDKLREIERTFKDSS